MASGGKKRPAKKKPKRVLPPAGQQPSSSRRLAGGSVEGAGASGGASSRQEAAARASGSGRGPRRETAAAGGSAGRRSTRGVQASRPTRPKWLVPGIMLVVAVVVVAAALLTGSSDSKKHTSAGPASTVTSASTVTNPSGALAAAVCTSDEKMDVYSTDGPAVHTDNPGYTGPLKPAANPVYKVDPPGGGDHLSGAAPAGDYDGDKVAFDGYYVHSMEHGYVVIWHHPDLSADDLAAIKAVEAKFPKDVLVVSRASMNPKVAATAWGHRLLCDGAGGRALADFVAKYRNQGPEKVPH